MTNSKKFSVLTVFLAAVALIGITGAVCQYRRAAKYKEIVNNSYSRSLTELTDSVENIGFSLSKGLLVNSPAQFVCLSNEINRYANSASANLGQLPLSDTELDNTEKFLAQAGDFTNALALKASTGNTITEQDYKTLKTLSDYSDKLSDSFQKIQTAYLSGKLSVQRLKNEVYRENNKFLTDMVSASEEDFVNYPSLIYDGPFSSHIDTIEYSSLKGLADVTSAEAKAALRQFIGNEKYIIKGKGEKGGKLPSYVFEIYSENSKSKNYITAEISKQGGKLCWFLNNRNPKTGEISINRAIQSAKDFLELHGYSDMRQSYYDCKDNVATINFAYVQNDIIMYPDLIKVKIAMDTGECIGFEASGFLMNNKDRSSLQPSISQEEAVQSVSAFAAIASVRLAVIPTEYMTEILCYELKGSVDDKNYLVYVNAKTGVQEKILILLESENGILTI